MVKVMFIFITALATFFIYVSLDEDIATKGELNDALLMLAPSVISYVGYKALYPTNPSMH